MSLLPARTKFVAGNIASDGGVITGDRRVAGALAPRCEGRHIKRAVADVCTIANGPNP
jgi:hypothetical protein